MAEESNQPSDEALEKALFRVRPTKQARREDLFKTVKEKLWVISQLKLLKHWPLDKKQEEQLGIETSYSKVHHRNETFYELRLSHDPHLHQKNLRVFFWIWEKSKTIWIIHGYWKKSDRLEDSVKTNVARKIKALKGSIQDGSVK